MHLTSEEKKNIFAKYSPSKSAGDAGSPESQVALFTARINHLTEHLKRNKQDTATQMGLIRLVGQRKKQLAYLKNKDITRYREIIKELNIRK